MSICKDFKPLGKERCVYEAERTPYTCVCGLKSRNCKIFNPIIESSCLTSTEYFFETYTSIYETYDSTNSKHVLQFDLNGKYEKDLDEIWTNLSAFSPLGKGYGILIEVEEKSIIVGKPTIGKHKFKATNLILNLSRNSTNIGFRTYSCTFIGEIV